MADQLTTIKTIIIGDGGCGKTALVYAYFRQEFNDDYISTTMEMYEYEITSKKGSRVKMILCDTSGQEGYEEIRKLQYNDVNVFLICYDVVAMASLNNIEKHWIKEVRKEADDCPTVLCGNKLDLAEQYPQEYVSSKIAKNMQYTCGCYASHQCSSRYHVDDKEKGGIEDVFESVMAIGLAKAKPHNIKKCVIL